MVIRGKRAGRRDPGQRTGRRVNGKHFHGIFIRGEEESVVVRNNNGITRHQAIHDPLSCKRASRGIAAERIHLARGFGRHIEE